mgnify:CR=1 FL=1|tara:strand:+ start:14263 stop:22827 length:8565 start_codon:yes stop_codon:yes gene_type:complete
MDKFKELYQYLVDNEMTDLSEEEFKVEYAQGTDKNSTLFTYLQDNELTDLDQQAFNSKYFPQQTQVDVDVVADEVTDVKSGQEVDSSTMVEETVAYDPREQGMDDKISYNNNATVFEKSLAYVTPDLIDREEEEVVNRMNYHFGDYGFTFEEGGGIMSGMDGMSVRAENGQTINVNLDPVFGDLLGGETQESNKLQDFLKKNKKTNPELEAFNAENNRKRKKYFSKKAVDEDLDDLKTKATSINKRAQVYQTEKTKHEEAMDGLLMVPPQERGADWQLKYQQQLGVGKRLNELKQTVSNELKSYRTIEKQVHSAVGNYMEMKLNDGSGPGTFLKGFYNSVVGRGVSQIFAYVADLGIDGLYKVGQAIDEDFSLRSLSGVTDEEKKERYITIAKDLGYDVPSDVMDSDESYQNWLNSLSEDDEMALDGDTDLFTSQLNKEGRKALKDSGKELKNINGKLQLYDPKGGILGKGGYEDVPADYLDKTKRDKLDRLVLDAEVKSAKKPTKEFIKKNWNQLLSFDDVSDEKIAEMRDDSIIAEGLLGLGESLPAIGLSLASRGKIKATGQFATLRNLGGRILGLDSKGGVAQVLAFSALQAEAMQEEMDADEDFKYVTEGERKAILGPTALTVAVLERYGLRNIVGNKTIMTGLMSQVTKVLPQGASAALYKSTLEKIVKSNIAKGLYTNKAVKFSTSVAKAALAEAETGGLQQIAEMGYKDIWNDMNEKEMFDQPKMWSKEFWQEAKHAAMAEAVGGFVMGIPGGIVNAYKTGETDNISDATLELFDAIRGDNITMKAYKEQLSVQVSEGKKTQKEADEELLQFETLSGAANTIPVDLDITARKKALGLIFERQGLEAEMEGMDKDLGSYKKKEARVQEIKNELSQIGSEQADDSASLEKESENIPIFVSEEKAKEELVKEGIANPTQEQIKEKQDALQKSEAESLDVPKSTESGPTVGKGNKGTTTNQGTQENKDASQTKSEEKVTKEEQEDIDAFFGEEVGLEVESSSDNLSINRQQKDGSKVKDTKLSTQIIKRAKLAAKAIKKIAPNVKMVLHQTTEEFEKFAPKGNGYYNPNTKVIHINLATAKNKTVAHEVFHAVFLEKIAGGDKGAIAAADRLIKSVRKSLPNDSMLAKRMDAFANKYKDSAFQNEERVAELFSLMATEYKSLTKPAKNRVVEFIKSVAKKLGIKISNDFTSSDEAVIDFLNTFSKKVQSGEEVVESDLTALDEINEQLAQDGTAPIGNPTEINKPQEGRQSKIKFDDSYPLSLVTPENKIDINSLIDNISNKKQKVWFWVADQLGLGNVDGIEMDAGPSFSLQPENLKKKTIWASGLDNSKLSKNIDAADYIFIISGSPETSKLFNKKVFDRYIKDLGDYAKFKKDALATNPTKAIRDSLEEFDSWSAMRKSPKRKNFLIALNEQSRKPNTKFHALINNLGGFVSAQSLRDGFYRDNNFAQNDIMMVLKPTGLGGKSNHSTYSTDILGDVVGVPDAKINAREIVPENIKKKIEGTNISVQTSSIAPYGGSTQTAVKTITKPQEGRQQRDTLAEINVFYNMNNSGFFSPQVDTYRLQKELDALNQGYKLRQAPFNQYGQGGGYSIYDSRGKRVRPPKDSEYRQGRQQKMDNENDLLKIIIIGREQAGFRDAAIKDYLKRRKKEVNGKLVPAYSASEINNAMDVVQGFEGESYLFTAFPKSFNNMEGGFLAGLKLLKKVNTYYKRLIKANNKKKSVAVDGTPLTEEQIRQKVIDYFTGLQEYQNEGAQGNRLTAQQMAMEKDLLELLLPDPLKANPQRIRAINKRIKEIKFDEKNIKAVQRALRNYIRSVLPRDLYTKSEIVSLIDKVNRINKTNFESVKDEVFKVVTSKTNKSLQESIFNILNRKFTTIQSGRLKGVSIDNETRKKIERINSMIVNPKSTADEIMEANEQLLKEYNSIAKEEVSVNKETRTQAKSSLDEDALSRLAEITIAMQINNSFLAEMNDPNKTTLLSEVLNSLNQMQETGRANLEYVLLNDAITYRENERKVFKEMTGIDLDAKQSLIDQGIPENEITEGMINVEFNKLKQDVSVDAKRKGGLKPPTVRKRFQNLINKMLNSIDRNVFASAEDLTGLIDRIVTQPGELFEGDTQTIVQKAVREATRMYKARMMGQKDIFENKMTELFGKKWLKNNAKNSQQTETIIISQAKNDQLVKEKEKVMADKSLTSGERTAKVKKLDEAIDTNTIYISQNQLMYYYSQMQDPSLQESFINTFAPTGNYKNEFESRIRKELEDKLDPRLKEFSSWMINDYYPSLYNHYNETYKQIYRTDMPWNQFYAGRVYRKNANDSEGLDLLADSNNSWMTNVGAASSKVRLQNSNPISMVDGMDALINYTKDMEYFAAYAVPVRNINKIFTSPAIKETIQEKYGKDVWTYINDAIEKIANKGVQNQGETKVINLFNNTFLLSRLGLNPTLTLKQLTSFVTYGNEIGYGNWLKNSAISLANIKTNFREVMDNSVILQDRYGKPITRAVENYSDSKFEEMNARDFSNFGLGKQNLDKITKVLMFTTMTGDKGAILIGGIPNYVYYKNQYKKKNPNASKQEVIEYAIRKFEQDTLRTQQSYDLQDKDYYQGKGAMTRAFNMFLTTPKQYFRKEIIAMRNIYRLAKSGGASGRGTIFQNLRTLGVYHVVMPVFFQWVSSGFPGLARGWDDEDTDDIAFAAMLGNLNALFIYGKIAETIVDAAAGKPWVDKPSTIPVLGQTALLGDLYVRMKNAKSAAKQQEAFNKLMSELVATTGIPAPQIKRFYENWSQLDKSKSFGDFVLKLFNFSQYAQKKKKKGGGLTKAEKKKYFPDLFDTDDFEGTSEANELKKEQKRMRQELLNDMF